MQKLNLVAALAIACISLIGCGKGADVATPAAPMPAANDAAAQKDNLAKPDKNTPAASYAVIESGNQLMFLYAAYSGLPFDYNKEAERFSEDYEHTQDAFKRQDLLATLKPQMDAGIEKAKANRYIVWNESAGYHLKHYDVIEKSFTLTSDLLMQSRYAYMTDNSRYSLRFNNGMDYTKLLVPDQNQARMIEAILTKEKPVQIRFYAFVQGVDTEERLVNAEVTRVQVLDEKGMELATYSH